MDTQNKLKEIEATDYWDAQILDINTRFLGDELSLYDLVKHFCNTSV